MKDTLINIINKIDFGQVVLIIVCLIVISFCFVNITDR